MIAGVGQCNRLSSYKVWEAVEWCESRCINFSSRSSAPHKCAAVDGTDWWVFLMHKIQLW